MPTATVVQMGWESAPSCVEGYCLNNCSHLMWYCKACTSEGGWGCPRADLERMAVGHFCDPIWFGVVPTLGSGNLPEGTPHE